MHRRTLIPLTVAIAVITASPAVAATGPAPQWQRALAIRSDALDRHYHLGRYAIPKGLTTPMSKAALRALEVRSDALDQRYHLGRYSLPAVRQSSGFGWGTALLAAAGAAALCALAAAFAFRSRFKPHQLS
jgi:hypothetical protein